MNLLLPRSIMNVSNQTESQPLVEKLKHQVGMEEERFKVIREIRRNHPLYLEDHDFLYLLIQ